MTAHFQTVCGWMDDLGFPAISTIRVDGVAWRSGQWKFTVDLIINEPELSLSVAISTEPAPIDFKSTAEWTAALERLLTTMEAANAV